VELGAGEDVGPEQLALDVIQARRAEREALARLRLLGETPLQEPTAGRLHARVEFGQRGLGVEW